MKRQRVSFEWQVAEDEASWNKLAFQPTTLAEERPRAVSFDHRLIVHLLRTVAMGLVTIALVTGVDLPPEELARRQAIAGIGAILTHEAQEESIARTSDRLQRNLSVPTPPLARIATDEASLTETNIGLVRIELVGNLVMAEVLLSQPISGQREAIAYRETRFYRQVDQGWRRAKPDQTFWGIPLRRETTHLRFVFFERDAATVEPLLEQLETIYLDLYRQLNLAVPSITKKLTIEITPNYNSGRGIYRNRLQVTSPLLSQIPRELAATPFLTHQIVSQMVSEAINGNATSEVMGIARAESFLFRWRAMRRGLRSWLQTDLLAQPWPSDRQATELFFRTLQKQTPLTLDRITWGTELPLADEERMMWQNAAAESVVAYVVESYGREHLPDLLRGFHQYDDWSNLVAGAFGISVAEFEDGWNRYLAHQAALTVSGKNGQESSAKP